MANPEGINQYTKGGGRSGKMTRAQVRASAGISELRSGLPGLHWPKTLGERRL